MLNVQGEIFSSITPHRPEFTAAWAFRGDVGEGAGMERAPGMAQQEQLQALHELVQYLEAHNPLRGIMQPALELMHQSEQTASVAVYFRGTPGTTDDSRLAKEPAMILAGRDRPAPKNCHVVAFCRRDDGRSMNNSIFPGDPGYFEMLFPMLITEGHGGWYDYARRELVEIGLDGQPVFEGFRVPAHIMEAAKAGMRDLPPNCEWGWVTRKHTNVQGDTMTLHAWAKRALYQMPHLMYTGSLYSTFLLNTVAIDMAMRLEADMAIKDLHRFVPRQDLNAAADRAAE